MNIFEEKTGINPLAKVYIKNWKIIFYTVLGCTLLATIASFMLTPRYSAKTSFFIPYNISYDLAIENPQFGYDIEADRLLQIINSEQFRDSVDRKFNLVNYYKIDTADFEWRDLLSEKYKRRIVASRTNVMSIVIEAETHDPYFSKEIVAYILDLTQKMRERLLKTNSELAVEAFKNQYLNKQAEVDSIDSRIIKLRKENNANPIALVNNQFIWGNGTTQKVNPEVAVELEILTQKHINEAARLNDLKGKYENALNLAMRPIPQFYMLDKPTPIFKKVFPLIGFNITIAFLGSLFFMMVGFYLQYVVKSIKQYSSQP